MYANSIAFQKNSEKTLVFHLVYVMIMPNRAQMWIDARLSSHFVAVQTIITFQKNSEMRLVSHLVYVMIVIVATHRLRQAEAQLFNVRGIAERERERNGKMEDM